MSKVTLNDVVNLENQNTAVNTINVNNAYIETAFDNTLSRDGSTPNQMGADLDMNSHRILNLPVPITNEEPLRVSDLTDFLSGSLTLNINTTFASQAEAEAGTDNTKLMTPLRVAQETTARLASQAQAEAGTENTKLMTPLRTAQAISEKISIPCTSTWVNASGFGNYTLTAVGTTVPATLPVGTRLKFIASDTSDTGRIQARLTGVSSPAGFLNIYGPDGRIPLTFHDIAKGDYVTLELSSGGDFILVSPTQSKVQSLFNHGSVNISAGGFKGIAPGNHIVAFGPYDGGNIVVKDPVSGAFRKVHFETSGLATNIFDGTSYVEGVLGTLPSDEFWFVYCFLKSSNPSDLALDFSQTVSNISHLGHQIKSDDDSRTYLGMIYTKGGDVGFNGTGNNPQVLVRSIFNHFQLPIMTTGVTMTGVTSTSFVDVTNATMSVVIDAVTKLPSFNCICNYANDTSAAGAEMRLKVDGLSVGPTGAQTTYTNYSDIAKTTCPGVNKYTQFSCQYGQALDTGYVNVTPQVRVLTGTGVFEPSLMSSDT